MRSRREVHGRAALSVLGAAIFVAAAATAHASGPWTLDRNGYFARGELLWLASNSQFDALGVEVEAPGGAEFKDRTLQFQLEYGLRDRLTLDLGLPLRFLSHEDDFGTNDANQGFGDIRIGLRYRALDDPAVVSVQVDAQLPSGYNAGGFGRPPLGRGESSVTPRLLAGYTLAPTPAYAQGEFGRQIYFDDMTSHHWVAAAEAGWWPTSRLLVLGEWRWQEHVDADKLFEDVFSVGGQARYRFHDRFEALAGVRHILGGQNTLAGTGLVLGLTYKGNALAAFHGASAGGPGQSSETVPAATPSGP